MKLIEQVKLEIVDHLQDNLSTKLAALESEYADGVLLPAPATEDYYDLSISDENMNVAFPAILILATTTSNNNNDGIRGGDAYTPELSLTHMLHVSVAVTAQDKLELIKKKDRYARAVVEILSRNDALPSGQCILRSINWDSPLYTSRDGIGSFLQDVPMIFTVETLEEA
jgi:hypothetical protein